MQVLNNSVKHVTLIWSSIWSRRVCWGKNATSLHWRVKNMLV